MENGILFSLCENKMLIRNNYVHNNIKCRNIFYSLCIKGETGNVKSGNKKVTGNLRSAASRDISHSKVPLLRILDPFNHGTMERLLEVNNILIHFTIQKSQNYSEF